MVGDLMDVPVEGAALPPVCAKCGATNDLQGRVEVFVLAPLSSLLALGGGLSDYLDVRENTALRAVVTIPLCRPCEARWSGARRFMNLSFCVGPAVFVLGVFTMRHLFPASVPVEVQFEVLIALTFVLSAAIPLVVFLRVLRRRTIQLLRIQEGRAHLAGASPAMLDAARASLRS